MPERLGVLGGTFDPVHIAHLVAAMEARDQLALDRVLLVVARDPWQKAGQVVAPAEVRFEMVAAAVDGVAGLEASRVELDRPGPTYTIDTVVELEAPQRELFLVLGSDAASRLETWKRAPELRERVTLALVCRGAEDDCDDRLDGWRVVSVAMPLLDVSSTDIRARVAAGRPIDFLVPAPAVRVLREHHLYTRR
jgi:nicotinate-nucleotide adenylyltransferase